MLNNERAYGQTRFVCHHQFLFEITFTTDCNQLSNYWVFA